LVNIRTPLYGTDRHLLFPGKGSVNKAMISTERKRKNYILTHGLLPNIDHHNKEMINKKAKPIITAGLIKIESFMVKLQPNTTPTSLKTAIDGLAYIVLVKWFVIYVTK